MPRVAFCIHHSQPGGATLWLKRFLMDGGAPGVESIVIMPAESQVADELRGAGFTVHTLGLKEVAITEAGAAAAPGLLMNRAGAIARYRDIIREEKIDIVYINSSVNLAPLVAAKFARVPAVVHVHEIPAIAPAFKVKRSLIRRWAAGCLFASQKGMEAFGKTPPGKRWEFCPNGVSPALANLALRRDELRRANGFAPDEEVILFLGNISVLKGVHHLLQSWKAIEAEYLAARLVLAGRHDPDKSHPIIDELLQNRIPRAQYLGFRNDAAELLAASDIFVLPSLAEAMPLSIVEAMMIGTPVIARNVGDVGWLLADGRGKVYDDESQLTGILSEALGAADKLKPMAMRAQEFAKKELTAERQKEQIFKFLGAVS